MNGMAWAMILLAWEALSFALIRGVDLRGIVQERGARPLVRSLCCILDTLIW